MDVQTKEISTCEVQVCWGETFCPMMKSLGRCTNCSERPGNYFYYRDVETCPLVAAFSNMRISSSSFKFVILVQYVSATPEVWNVRFELDICLVCFLFDII